MSVTPNRNDVTYQWYALLGAYPPSSTFVYNPRNNFLDTGIDLVANAAPLFGWGSNSVNQLGDGTTTDRNAPVPIGTDIWSAIACGGGHSLGISGSQKLFSWGEALYGCLGDGTTSTRSSPVQVGTSNWSAVAAGAYSSYAIRSDGKLFAWGDNSVGAPGKLGDGTTINRSTPVQIGTDNWIKISANYQHVAAIRSDGKLFAWGSNSSGQLGDGTTTNRSTPVQIGTDSYTAVAASFRTVLAIRSDSKLFAWGDNFVGSVGDNTTTNRNAPVQIGSGNWSSVAIGNYSSFAITTPTSTSASRLTVSATGTINIGWPAYPNSNGPNGKTEVGYNDATTGLPHAALIGKIGINGSYFLIGSSYDQIVTTSGRLYVGMYDPIRGDNSGSFTLNITSPTIGSQNLIASPSYIGKEVFIDTSAYSNSFSSLVNSSIYSGVSTNTLTISSLATTSYNGVYRCIMTFSNKSLIIDVGTRYKL
jgi:alpha-tubulin suppressor-like RCC1 family protein